jgi:hypothetical protein
MANLFGTLNRFISRLDSDPNSTGGGHHSSHSHHAPSGSTGGYGFQILRNTSPTNIPLEPWFDFIIGINGRTIDNPSASLFATELRNCAGSTISIGVYSAKGQVIREMYISIPPEIRDGGASLGLALQWAPLNVVEDVWHILDVMPNSPADVAGLLPYGDYVIGSPDNVPVRGEAGLGALVEQFMERPLRLWVYNHEYDVTRMITLTPSKNWGGDGALGCVLGYGALHRVPAPLNEPAQGPGETLFSSDNIGADSGSQQLSGADYSQPQQPAFAAASEPASFIVPANMPFVSTKSPPPGAPPAGAGPPPAGKPKKARAHHTAVAGLDDYFAEGEQKSREIDKPSTPAKTGGLPPPPPKAGGPPPKAASPAPAPPAAEPEKAEEAA